MPAGFSLRADSIRIRRLSAAHPQYTKDKPVGLARLDRSVTQAFGGQRVAIRYSECISASTLTSTSGGVWP
jgi:hypothetical protein